MKASDPAAHISHFVSAIIASCRFQSTSMNTPATGPTSGLAASLSMNRSSISRPCSISGISLQALTSKSERTRLIEPELAGNLTSGIVCTAGRFRV